jgi:hypothetical protein
MIFQLKLTPFLLVISLAFATPAGSATSEWLKNSYLPGELKFEIPDESSPEPLREKIDLAGEWQAQLLNETEKTTLPVPGLFTFQGSVIYSRSFFLAEDLKTRHVKLVAEGINYRSSIFINEKFVGTHYGGFTRFTFDIAPEFLRFDDNNEIRILVDNWLDPRQTIPAKHRPFAERNYGGIHRELYLLILPKLMLEDFTFRLLPGADSVKLRLDALLTLRNLNRTGAASPQALLPENKFRLVLKLWAPQTARKNAARSQVDFTLNSQILQTYQIALELQNPQLWSPESPFLYDLEVTLEQGNQVIDSLHQRVGLRTISIEHNKFLCNHKPYFIKGVEWHPDWTPTTVARRSEFLKQTVGAIKNLGVNAVRVVGFPPDLDFIEQCNQTGLFVFEELPIQFVPNERFLEPGWLELAEIQVTEMVLRDRNQPSVIAWGIGTGLDARKPEIQAYLAHTRDFIQQQDSRPVYVALSALHFAPEIPVTDFCFVEITDLTRVDLNVIIAASENHLAEKPVIYSIGYPFTQSETHPVPDIQKESRQSYFLGLAARKIMAKTRAGGIFINALADWHLAQPSSLFGKESPPDVAPYGLISVTGGKRLAYHHLAALFSEDKTTPLTAIHLPNESTNFFTIAGILLLLLFITIYKRDRRIRVDFSRSIQRPHGFITDIRENRKIPIFETIGLSLVITLLLALVSASLVFYFKNNFYFDQISSLVLLNPALKTRVIRFIWHPGILLAAFFFGYFFIFFTGAILIKFLSKLFGKKTSLHKAITYVFWMNAVVLILLPASPVFYKLLNLSGAAPVILGGLGLLFLFMVLRTIRGLAVLFFEKKQPVLLIILLLLTTLVVSAGIYYQKSHALFDYLAFYLNRAH